MAGTIFGWGNGVNENPFPGIRTGPKGATAVWKVS